ncbi:MAG TPA: hypothetical protein VD885_07280 [Methylophilaceae bacterium]|jgi:hypothetical protein|nr:hypothetical protein [Methylophilaceae bacterium]
MKRISVMLNAIIATTVLAANAAPVTSTIHNEVIAKAEQSDKGVIMVLAPRGDVAAEAAFLLAAQIKQNPGYAPLLVIAERAKLQDYMQPLALTGESLPAVVFFDKSGRELNRVIAAQPAAGAQQRMLTAALR